MNVANPLKPLGHRGYGSIPHLPGSRLGPGDHKCHEGQQAICWHKVRSRHDRIIVTEKLDGSNVSIANVGGQIMALGRAGYLAQSSKYEQHHLFAGWVREREDRLADLIPDGHRLVGEWLAQAHGTRYELAGAEPFIAFDLMTGAARLPFNDLVALCKAGGITSAAVLHDGGAFPLDAALAALGRFGHHGALDPVEGAVWRVETRGAFDFIAKFVRHDKQDGCFLPDISGQSIIWNWRP